MSQLVTVKLSKSQGTTWGFRLQGGKDFATPLCIQKVNAGSVAEKAGLEAGDAIISIASQDALQMRHKEAQDAIIKAGCNFEIVVQRGSQIWKPAVVPLAQPQQTPEGPVATKTSLHADAQGCKHVGSGHNTTAIPFGEVNGKTIVNAQYNSPLNLYSDDSIAETLSAQAEVLGKGVLGVNFMKNDRVYDGRASDVLRMVQEMDREPSEDHLGTVPARSMIGLPDRPIPQGYSFKLLEASLQDHRAPSSHSLTPCSGMANLTPVRDNKQQLQPGENLCSECGRLIVGVFVRIKNKNLHADCFRCSTCGTSLKNVGYYNINEKLYCDVHAKQAARNNPPAANMEPVTVKPGATPPPGAVPASEVKAPLHIRNQVPTPFKPPAGGIKIFPSSTMPMPPPPPFQMTGPKPFISGNY